MRFLRWIGSIGIGLALTGHAAHGILIESQGGQTTLVVNTTTDDSTPNNGTCSLREAVQAATTDRAVDACPAGSASDTIHLAAGVYQLTGGGSRGLSDLSLNGTIALVGVNSASTIIDANRMSRAFTIVDGNVTLRNLHIRHGVVASRADGEPVPVYGHGIFHQAGSLTIDSSLIRANGIITDPNIFGYDNYGGGIATMSGYLTITNSVFDENRVRDVYMGGTGAGGSLYIDTTTVWISDSIFRGSSAGSGSAIYNNAGHVTINTSQFTNYRGQGDYAVALTTRAGEVRINESVFSANNPGAISIGGGSVHITTSQFLGNGGNGSFYCSYGGAIASSGNLVVSNSRFVQNWANEVGAIGVITGTTTIDHSEFSANATHATETGRSECWGNGGAMRTGYGGVVTIDASTLPIIRLMAMLRPSIIAITRIP